MKKHIIFISLIITSTLFAGCTFLEQTFSTTVEVNTIEFYTESGRLVDLTTDPNWQWVLDDHDTMDKDLAAAFGTSYGWSYNRSQGIVTIDPTVSTIHKTDLTYLLEDLDTYKWLKNSRWNRLENPEYDFQTKSIRVTFER